MKKLKTNIVLFLAIYCFKDFVYAQTHFSGQKVITETDVDQPCAVYSADLDGDSDLDVLSASWLDNKIAWYENDGTGNFGAQQVITTDAPGANSVYASDLDGDGDLDVLSASSDDGGKIAWYENDGSGNFGAQQEITPGPYWADRAQDVYASDLDGDGDMDVLAASEHDGKISWYENDGTGNFGTQIDITTHALAARDVYAADLDGDGDMDVISASNDGENIAWYENYGSGSFSDQKIIDADAYRAESVHASDLDGDGDMDVLAASRDDNNVTWYENNGSAGFSTEKAIETKAYSAQSVYASDLDGDGDMDVLAGLSGVKIAWYENDGTGSFGIQQIIAADQEGVGYSVYASDLDGDGDMDVLSASIDNNKIAWYENLLGEENEFPDIVISPLSKYFGDIHVGLYASQTFTVTNEGSVNLTVSSASIIGDVDFTITSGGGSFTLAPEASREVIVRFSPISTGTKSAILRFQSDDPDENPLDVALSGNGTPVSIVEESGQIPIFYTLYQNYPNPFNPSTQIKYDVKESCQVQLVLYNLSGQIVSVIVNTYQQKGVYIANLDLQYLPSGIYLYKIQMGSFQDNKKFVKME